MKRNESYLSLPCTYTLITKQREHSSAEFRIFIHKGLRRFFLFQVSTPYSLTSFHSISSQPVHVPPCEMIFKWNVVYFIISKLSWISGSPSLYFIILYRLHIPWVYIHPQTHIISFPSVHFINFLKLKKGVEWMNEWMNDTRSVLFSSFSLW